LASKIEDKYPLGRSQEAAERLITIAQEMRVSIQRFLVEAGLSSGMKVLDVGCGAGDVSFLVADIIGPSGSVLGIDLNANIIQTARSRAREAGAGNVEFQTVRIPDELDAIASDFDAIVGRRVLCYIPSAVDALRALVTHLRSGGIVAFKEVDFTVWSQNSFPVSPAYEQLWGWISRAFEAGGTDMAMGTRLYPVFLEAGLSEPVMRAEAGIGPATSTVRFAMSLLTSVRDTILREGIATAADIDPEGVQARLARDFAESPTVVTGGFEVSAWATKP
jgi:SAM-dependent methyltransferase